MFSFISVVIPDAFFGHATHAIPSGRIASRSASIRTASSERRSVKNISRSIDRVMRLRTVTPSGNGPSSAARFVGAFMNSTVWPLARPSFCGSVVV